MSLTKRFMQFDAEQDAIRLMLQHLIDDEKISNPASVGVAKKVIAEGNLDGLSEAQRTVFSRFIAPKMNLACEQCNAAIPAASYPEVIANSGYEGQVICESCLNFKQQMRKD
jgi:hypothetical protein